MDFIQRFKERKIVSPTLDVKFGEFVLKVERFSQAEMSEAGRDSERMMRQRGLEPKVEDTQDPKFITQQDRVGSLCCAVAPFVIRHLKGWTHKPVVGDEIPYSKENAQLMLDAMTDVERAMLGLAYFAASDDDQKKMDKAA